jgi:UDP-N-acetyl-D-glucosamine dehydrogenase
MKSIPLSPAALGTYDCAVIATDHSAYDFASIVESSQLVVDTRNAARRVTRHRERIVQC